MLFLHEVCIYIKKHLTNFELGIDMVKRQHSTINLLLAKFHKNETREDFYNL